MSEHVTTSRAQSPAPTTPVELSHQLATLIASAVPMVVAVHGRRRAPSSGLIWQPGLAVSAAETVERDDDLAVTLPDGRHVEASLVGRDASTDIALLRIAGESSAAGLASSAAASDLKPGHLALAVGRRHDHVIAAHGIVSLVGPPWHSRAGGLIDARLRIDARLPPTAEGGALIAADGALIGMAVFGPRRSVLAIPAATIARIARVLEDKGHVARGYLGIGAQRVPVPSEPGAQPRSAAMVVTLDPDGPGKAAGMLQGDIVLTIDGTAVTGPRSLYRQLGPETVGQRKTVEVIRAGATVTLEVTIAPRPRA
jgi:S1-C subfamily serine protease